VFLVQQLPDALGEPLGTGRRFVELPVEIVEKLADRLGVCQLPDAHAGLRQAVHRCSSRFPASMCHGATTSGGRRRRAGFPARPPSTGCEEGATCTTGRQLFDDFGVDTDSHGWAHIAFSHDSPGLGGPGTYTGYAVQTGGTAVGQPNN
jgi:hypothetical protein